MAAAVVGTRQVFFAVLATTATLVSVFVPIAFLPGTAGQLFIEFGFVLAIAVMISSFVALSLCPMLAARLPVRDSSSPQQGPRLFAALGDRAEAVYRRFLDFVLSARLLVLGSTVGIALLAVAVYPTLDEELLPREDRGGIRIMLQGPDGVGLDYMDRQAVKAEAILQPLRDSGEITAIYTIVGRWDLNRVCTSPRRSRPGRSEPQPIRDRRGTACPS